MSKIAIEKAISIAPEMADIAQQNQAAQLEVVECAKNAYCPCPAGLATNECAQHGDPRARKLRP